MRNLAALMRFLTWMCVALILASCGPRMDRSAGPVRPLLFNPVDVAAQDTLLVLVPGTLTPMAIFDPVVAWTDRGYALAVYRFPGMDGRPLDRVLSIEDAAASIVALAGHYPDKDIKLLGFSTGAIIALLAAEQIGPRAQVAALSSAVEHGGGLQTGGRGLADLVTAAAGAKSLKPQAVWRKYFPTLLFGREGGASPARAADIDRILNRKKKALVSPSASVFRAHTGRLPAWRLPEGFSLPKEQVRFFAGAADTVFKPAQTRAFAQAIGGAPITFYPGIGHLSFIAEPRVFDDILAFFEGG